MLFYKNKISTIIPLTDIISTNKQLINAVSGERETERERERERESDRERERGGGGGGALSKHIITPKLVNSRRR